MNWDSEAAMVKDFTESVCRIDGQPWTVYAETAGWDLLLQHQLGYQLGIEAKLRLNAKVIDQALSGTSHYRSTTGPDYRAVLVPFNKVQHHLRRICDAIGIGILAFDGKPHRLPDLLPDETQSWRQWPNWCPSERCRLPDYVPDVAGGAAAPVQLTPWKIKAIKLMIVLDRRGYVTRADMKALEISPTRWTDIWSGLLQRAGDRRFVAGPQTPDFRKEHPRNYPEVEADFDVWASRAGIEVGTEAGPLFRGAA